MSAMNFVELCFSPLKAAWKRDNKMFPEQFINKVIKVFMNWNKNNKEKLKLFFLKTLKLYMSINE